MILCCGEALIDLVPLAAPSGAMAYRPVPGGAVFNTAIALGKLGADVGMLSGVSTDPFGQTLKDALTGAGVATWPLVMSDRPTTLAVAHLTNGAATYSFYDEGSAGRMMTPKDTPPLQHEIRALFFGGISLVGEPAADAYAALLEREGPGRVVMLDPNIRPGFIRDETSYRARLARMMEQTSIVKLSDEDLDWLLPGPSSLEDKARRVLARGPQLVLITRGPQGAVAVSGTCTLHAPAHAVDVVDTIGAGDVFNAGFLRELDRRNLLQGGALSAATPAEIEAALRLGTAAAAITCTRAGAQPPGWAELAPLID